MRALEPGLEGDFIGVTTDEFGSTARLCLLNALDAKPMGQASTPTSRFEVSYAIPAGISVVSR